MWDRPSVLVACPVEYPQTQTTENDRLRHATLATRQCQPPAAMVLRQLRIRRGDG